MDKTYLKSLAYKDFNWHGFWDGYHHFIKGDNRNGFIEVKANEKDLTDGNLKMMIDLGMTRT